VRDITAGGLNRVNCLNGTTTGRLVQNPPPNDILKNWVTERLEHETAVSVGNSLSLDVGKQICVTTLQRRMSQRKSTPVCQNGIKSLENTGKNF
jgi:hypothetical protein